VTHSSDLRRPAHLPGVVGPVPVPGVGFGLGVLHLTLQHNRVAHIAHDGLVLHLAHPGR